jgi:hypothetical protein
MRQALVLEAMTPLHITMIRSEYDDGILRDAQPVKRCQQPPDIGVYLGTHGVVQADVLIQIIAVFLEIRVILYRTRTPR